MRILHVTFAYKPAYRLGGPIWSVSALAERLAARGHEVTVFTTNIDLDEDLDVPADQPVDVDGVEVWYFRRREPLKTHLPWLKYFSQSIGYMYAPAMESALRRKLLSIDVVHTHVPYNYLTMKAGRLALAAKKPLFYHQRGAFQREQLAFRKWKKLAYIWLVEKPIMRRASGLIALSREEVACFRAFGLTTPIHLVPNGVDVTKFRRAPAPGALADLGITSAHKVLLFMGRIHSIKGVEVVVDAFIRVARRHPDAILVMAGPDECNLLDGIRVRIAAHDLSSRFLPVGFVAGERKLDLLARANLFVLASAGEGLSMAILEALASGTPVVISHGCNLPVVAEQRAGAIVNRTPEDFAAAICGLLEHPNELAAAGRRAHQLACSTFSWDPIVDRLEQIYAAACRPHPHEQEPTSAPNGATLG
jgi:glycosyltransferase involved in cell wall biosynthesis